MNVIDRIIDSINNTPNFFSPSISYDVDADLKKSALDFLKSNSNKIEDSARILINKILNMHDKAYRLGLTIESMRYFELYDKYKNELQRMHFPHLINVYLLGLYIYHNYKPIYNSFNDYIEKTKIKVIEMYNGNNELEFHYRWRLASLCHDMAYPIELCYGNDIQLKNCFKQLSSLISTGITSINDLYKYNDSNLLNEINNSIQCLIIKKYIEYQDKNPKFGKIYHDHGIYSALLFLKLMYEQFSHYNGIINERDDGTLIITNPILLHTSLLEVSKSIALHNIDSYIDAFNHSRFYYNIIYKISDPLTWLLKISDELQEWHKPNINNIEFSDTDLDIFFKDNNICINNYPKEKISDLEIKIKNHYFPSNILKLC